MGIMLAMGVLVQKERFAVAAYGNVFISVWGEGATLARLAELRRCERALADAAPEGLVVITLLNARSFVLGDAERAEAYRVAKEFASCTRATAWIIEGSRFMRAALRVMISAFGLVSREHHPSEVFSEVDAAVAWAAPLASPPVAPQTLHVAVDEAIAAAASPVRDAH
jgi:hypothetical protein